jgi:excisionase family DNA binding protein
MNHEYLTVPEVADLIRTTPKAIYDLVWKGRLPGVVRLGRRVLVKRASLLRWLDQNTTASLEN